jgi:hypothetical protein
MMDSGMGWMMGAMMGTGGLIALLLVAVLIMAAVALFRAIMASPEKQAGTPATTAWIAVVIIGGLVVIGLLAAGTMCGGMMGALT